MNTYNILEQSEKELVEAWEEIYKRGHLTYWALLAIWREPQDYNGLSSTIDALSHGTCSVNEQSLYRAMRRFDDAGLVNTLPGKDGRSKIYELTKTGRRVLKSFSERVITPFYSPTTEKTVKEVLL